VRVFDFESFLEPRKRAVHCSRDLDKQPMALDTGGFTGSPHGQIDLASGGKQMENELSL
jgi:hypothetical protein